MRTLEIILDKIKILLMELNKPLPINEKYFFFHLDNAYTFFCTIYESLTLIVDFNMILENKKLSYFCEMNKFEHSILKPTCFKGLLPSTIDLLLTNHKQNFMKSDVYETGICNHHKRQSSRFLQKFLLKVNQKLSFSATKKKLIKILSMKH